MCYEFIPFQGWCSVDDARRSRDANDWPKDRLREVIESFEPKGWLKTDALSLDRQFDARVRTESMLLQCGVQVF